MPPERRKNARLGLAIPVRVQGYRSDGSTWEEFTTTDDVSVGGACFALSHEVELGQILFLTLALPKRLRQFDLSDASYRIYTLVRSVRRRPDQPRVGVMYFGKYPPRGFHDRPGARYLLPSDTHGGSTVSPAPREPPSPEAPPPGSGAAEPSAPPEFEAPAPAAGTDPRQRAWEAAAAASGPGPDPYPEPGEPSSLSDGSGGGDEAGSPLDDLDESGSPTGPVDAGVLPPPSSPPPPPGARTVNWGTDAPVEPRPGVPPPPAADAPAVEFHPSRERRSTPRVERFVNFTIQQVDEWGAVLQEELTVADNVSHGGARVMTTLNFREGSIVLLQEAGGGFATRAEVRGITRAPTGTDRLHLRFLDRGAPDRILKQ